ncbi:MAG: Crp/Fnr family transcriptional regulator [Devosia sp.]|uniref:Crp/Fnr family transcriptional regulator n=1 Tax=Devosia sp. TaxID=1871048 RepID=UPI0024C642ED|nr:Crp/Fnr family transcriptional regulator [Devosia sp.]UYN99204.1 MAG: Crp/Fnr family transcriptional regulator [Devosia sp.]
MTDGKPGLAFWRSFPIFEDFSAEAIAELNAAAIPRKWGMGEVIFQRGDHGDHLVAVAEGRIRVALLTPSGRELTLRHAGPGEILGEMSLLDDAPRSADAVAAIASAGFVVLREQFERLMRTHPELQQPLIRYLSRRLRETTDQLESIALFDVRLRLARFLLLSLNQAFDNDVPDTPRLRLDLSQGEIASMLGASRPKVNRAILALEEDGAIARDGHVLTCDPAILHDIVAADGE